ncbi:unnamed protein product [Arctogadus glacialis]
MSSSGPALVGVVKRDWSSLSSIAISWTEVEQPPADILDYEVKYYEKEQEQLSYSSTRTKLPGVVVTGLKPGTLYVFRVRARTAAGYTAYCPKFEFATVEEDPNVADHGQVLVVVTAAVGGCSLLVVLTLFLLITGRWVPLVWSISAWVCGVFSSNQTPRRLAPIRAG